MTPRVLEFTDSVCKRPGMYVGTHNFRETVAFLAGYAWGLSATGANREEMATLADLLDRFQYWLAERFDASIPMPWSRLIEHAYPDDDSRLEQLARLLRECAAEVGSEAPKVDP